ncbi:DUF488 domain-containing protein [Bradyrhizobium sp. CB2312]|uniref:DUF488 domain-containing protein n=1 Tax=Bradyrhizobium sp. CB2312 TaxID=3039155 RepID=UPI0032C22A5E
MGSIEIKRVYEPRSRGDGERILVDRLWPRGLRKADAAIDLWIKDIAPTPSLRTWFDHRADRFDAFQRRYREELKSNPAVTEILEAIGNRKATLLYAAHDEAINHAVVLAEFLKRAATRGQRRNKAERSLYRLKTIPSK